MWPCRLDESLQLVPEDPAAVERELVEALHHVVGLRDDVRAHGTATDRTRLARMLSRAAWAEVLLGRPGEALPRLEEAFALFDGDARSEAARLVAIRRAWALVELHRVREAHEQLDRVEPHADDPADHVAWLAYGELCSLARAAAWRRSGENARAARALATAWDAIQARPRPADVHGVAQARERLGNGHPSAD